MGGWGGGGWDGGLLGKVGVKGGGDGQMVGWWDGGSGGWGVEGWDWFFRFLEPRPESHSIEPLGIGSVDFWSQAQKVIKSSLGGCGMSTWTGACVYLVLHLCDALSKEARMGALNVCTRVWVGD